LLKRLCVSGNEELALSFHRVNNPRQEIREALTDAGGGFKQESIIRSECLCDRQRHNLLLSAMLQAKGSHKRALAGEQALCFPWQEEGVVLTWTLEGFAKPDHKRTNLAIPAPG